MTLQLPFTACREKRGSFNLTETDIRPPGDQRPKALMTGGPYTQGLQFIWSCLSIWTSGTSCGSGTRVYATHLPLFCV